jgi:hypothetical protein
MGKAVITLSADGSPGQNSVQGKHGSNGVHSGAHGGSGGDATPAHAGTNACSLSVQIQQSQDNGTIQVIDSFLTHELSVDEDLILSARGGDGGRGADGGNGGDGAPGSKGRVRIVSDSIASCCVVLCCVVLATCLARSRMGSSASLCSDEYMHPYLCSTFCLVSRMLLKAVSGAMVDQGALVAAEGEQGLVLLAGAAE